MASIGFGKRSGLTPTATGGFGAAQPARRPLVNEPLTPEDRLSAAPAPPAPTAAPDAAGTEACVWDIHALISPQLLDLFPKAKSKGRARGELAAQLEEMVLRIARDQGMLIDDVGTRDTVTVLLNELIAALGGLQADQLSEAANRAQRSAALSKGSVVAAKERVHPLLM